MPFGGRFFSRSKKCPPWIKNILFTVRGRRLISYVMGLYVLTGTATVWFILDRLFITYWRRKLVSIPASSETGKPLSIYPDANLYVDIHGKAAILSGCRG